MTTLQVADEYNSYYNNPTAGRGCVGQKVESIYVGDIDCSDLKVGMEIDITYGKAIATKTGFYQPVKDIIVLD
ncbi:MAG: hypothetical protein PUC12_16450 [Clostridiales bacterium]|nr:hypothetical protein [Clostridiales bacterium]